MIKMLCVVLLPCRSCCPWWSSDALVFSYSPGRSPWNQEMNELKVHKNFTCPLPPWPPPNTELRPGIIPMTWDRNIHLCNCMYVCMITCDMGPSFMMFWNCSYMFLRVNRPFLMSSIILSSSMFKSFTRAIKPSMSPIPNSLLMNGFFSNGSRLSICSPVPMKITGLEDEVDYRPRSWVRYKIPFSGSYSAESTTSLGVTIQLCDHHTCHVNLVDNDWLVCLTLVQSSILHVWNTSEMFGNLLLEGPSLCLARLPDGGVHHKNHIVRAHCIAHLAKKRWCATFHWNQKLRPRELYRQHFFKEGILLFVSSRSVHNDDFETLVSSH